MKVEKKFWASGKLVLTAGCMRRFAQMNFQFYTKLDSKLSYTPCYTQYGLLTKN